MKRKTYYKTCSHCKANLDPGEQCDCQKDQQDTPKQTTKDDTAA